MLAFFSPLKRCISRGQGQTVLRYLRAALYLFNVHTLALAGLGCLAVYCCDKWRLSFNMDFSKCLSVSSKGCQHSSHA